ncbi:penicillin-binding protein 2 [Mariniphaga anaerophila]|uniref:Penicillin-binding protein 2 n=1 Tax=Mariniphaga anaerophila TaxID=1484053 RepID=A0A1M5FWX5_9BACT|nr:penicillin-binding protein 2 [Mariniphaga anaerophila]SHF95691.1 penicillin-binding protein 2 [Mariniphaga anaerophila]
MDTFSKRGYLIIGIFVLTGIIFIAGLFRLQVLDPTYKVFATNNVLREIVQYPARGLIYDRNGNLLVHNKPAYDLLVTPREVAEFDTTYLCNLLEITLDDFKGRLDAAREYSRYKPSIIVKQISPETYAVLQERLYRFRGFHTQSRTLREYKYPAAAHVLGYVGEVNQSDLKEDSYYSQGDYIGVSGIEKTYEKWLRGEKGIKKFLVDVHNRIQGSFLNGEEDTHATVGNNLTTSIDIELQLYAEKLMENKIGSVVAIEPSTGEILALVSAPSYHPGMLVGRVRGANYSRLLADTLKPLFNRALQAEYPPGSTFKMLNTLIALQEGTINLHTRFSCDGPESRPIRCTHYHVSPLGVVDAIRESCNPFLWNTFRSIINHGETAADGFNHWKEYVESFGLGSRLGTDLVNENNGNVPSEDYYNRYYGAGRWNALTVRSLSIGQGELGITPLQLANYSAAIANRGYYYVPHAVKNIEGEVISNRYRTKVETAISPEHFEPIIDGMQMVVENTNASVFMRIPGLTMCGKTGTVQNPHGKDHAAFMAFAPRENPQIAISVYVENSGYGSTFAAPIASLLVEKYLNREIAESRTWVETRMLEMDLLNRNQSR